VGGVHEALKSKSECPRLLEEVLSPSVLDDEWVCVLATECRFLDGALVRNARNMFVIFHGFGEGDAPRKDDG